MDRSSILRASTNSYKQVEKCLYLLFLLLKDTAENRTLCRARALRKRVSVFSPRARTPAGGRSRCGSAQRMRGILYAAPIEIEASGNGGFSYIAMH